MRLWMIPLLVLLVLWLISFLRVGADVAYDRSGLRVGVRIGPIRFPVFPVKKKDKPPKRKKREKQTGKERKPAAPQPVQKGGNLNLVRKFLPIAAEAAGRFKEKIRIDKIDLELVWGAPDPAEAALGFGLSNAALGMLWPLIEHNFNVRERQLRTSVDFQASGPIVAIYAVLSLTIGQGVVLGAVVGWKLFKLLRSQKKKQKINEAV